MDNQPQRSFRPDPTPRRADGLKDRMRSSAPGRPQPSNPRRTTPPNGEFMPPTPASPEPTLQGQVLNQHTQQQADFQERAGNAPLVNLPSMALPGFMKGIGPKSRILASKLHIPRLRSVNKAIVFRSGMALAGILIISVVGFGVYYVQEVKSSKNPDIPVGLKQQTGYEVLYPSKNNAAKVDETSFKYDGKDRLLSYIGYTPSKNKLIISQQAQPGTLKEGQPAFELLISRLQGYKTFKTENGYVSLTRPAQFQGDQFAVMRTKDSLLFIRPAKDLNDSQWKDIFNSFKPVK